MGTQQFASGLSPIDTEIITSTRNNTQEIISRGNWVEKYKNQVSKSQTQISANYYGTLLSVTGEGYFIGAYAKLASGTPGNYHQYEIWVDGVCVFTGAFITNGHYVGMATAEVLFSDASNFASLIGSLPTSVSITGNVARLEGIMGPNNSNGTSNPVLLLSQPYFFKNSLVLKVNNNQAVLDTVEFTFIGAVK